MRLCISSLLALLAVSGSVVGQDALSDNELFAGYCIGHFDRLLKEAQDVMRSTGCPERQGADASCQELNKAYRQGHEGISADRLRLQRYLVARGIFTVRRTPLIVAGLAAAQHQG